MNAKQAIRLGIDLSNFVATSYLGDLTDAEMMHRPDRGCNHVKWQVGHLISSEHMMVEGVLPGSMPPLPSGFAERYTKETAPSDDAAKFDAKEELLRVMVEQRAGTLAALEKCPDERLDEPSPESMRAYAPTVADVFSLQGGHWMMHAGQWAVARRQLGRQPLF